MKGVRIKGKISHSEWQAILARHDRGESFTEIARTYGCTAPAIRYIVQRMKASPLPSTDADLPKAAGSGHAKDPGEATQDQDIVDNVPMAGGEIADSSPSSLLLRRQGPAIDSIFRDRVNSDIARFVVAFDAAFSDPTSVHLKDLLDASDRLLQVSARTRLALEELKKVVGEKRTAGHGAHAVKRPGKSPPNT